MTREQEQAKLVRAFARRAVVHARKSAEEPERWLADAIALARPGCKCRCCRMLLRLKADLQEGRL